MANTDHAAKREAGKTSAKKVQKNNRHVEAKPLMTLEEAREVLKKHTAPDDGHATELLFDAAKNNLKEVFECWFNDKLYDYDNCETDYGSDENWYEVLREGVKDISDAVELMIAATINYHDWAG